MQQYDEEVYFIPKKTTLNSIIGPNADMVARYRFISKGDNVDAFYAGNTFANQIGISTQVPQVIEIVSNNVSDDGEVLIGNRRFAVRKPIVPITKENVYHQLSFGVDRDVLVEELQYYFEQTQAAEHLEEAYRYVGRKPKRGLEQKNVKLEQVWMIEILGET